MRMWSGVIKYIRALIPFLSLISIYTGCSSRPTVVFIIRDSSTMEFMIPNEIQPMITALNQAGYRTIVANEAGQTIKAGKEQLNVDYKLKDVDIQKCIGVVVPCCASGPMPKPNTESAIHLIKSALSLNIPIAAQYSGIDLLVLSGLPKEIKLARSFMFASPDTPPGIVIDKNVVTSGTCPWMARYQGSRACTEELMKDFINILPERN